MREGPIPFINPACGKPILYKALYGSIALCDNLHMATNLAIDDHLLTEVLKLGRFKTKRETVNTALQALWHNLRRKRIVKLAGKIDFDPSYDYKKERASR